MLEFEVPVSYKVGDVFRYGSGLYMIDKIMTNTTKPDNILAECIQLCFPIPAADKRIRKVLDDKTLRAMWLLAMNDLNWHKSWEDCSCSDCDVRATCQSVADPYNINGDCLELK